MKPRNKLAESMIVDGGVLTLTEHDGTFAIHIDGLELMNSRTVASEELLGSLGVSELEEGRPAKVLIGGLGLGFTLKSVLANVGVKTVVEVGELIPQVAEWNRSYLRDLNGHLLEDPRVSLRMEDVYGIIENAAPGTYDVILLDVDNGPVALVSVDNSALYAMKGLEVIRRALKSKGRVIFWSGARHAKFEKVLRKAKFAVEAVPAKVYKASKKTPYMLYVADC